MKPERLVKKRDGNGFAGSMQLLVARADMAVLLFQRFPDFLRHFRGHPLAPNGLFSL